MTRARFLAEADSAEITGWLAYFKQKDWYIKDAQQSAEFQRRINQG